MEKILQDHKHDENSACAYLGGAGKPLSPRTLQRWRLTGDGPAFIKVGHAVRYLQSDDMDAFFATGRRVNTTVNVRPPYLTKTQARPVMGGPRTQV
jgi:hypothetical protein